MQKNLNRKPLIPIHHMKAHALTIRMIDPTVGFPFLCFLISGGHCLLAWVRDVDEFILLGESKDDAPGEAFDKVARRLKIRHLGGEFAQMSGGQAIEKLAEKGNNQAFDFVIPMAKHQDCCFSFSGLKAQAQRHIQAMELKHGKQLIIFQICQL